MHVRWRFHRVSSRAEKLQSEPHHHRGNSALRAESRARFGRGERGRLLLAIFSRMMCASRSARWSPKLSWFPLRRGSKSPRVTGPQGHRVTLGGELVGDRKKPGVSAACALADGDVGTLRDGGSRHLCGLECRSGGTPRPEGLRAGPQQTWPLRHRCLRDLMQCRWLDQWNNASLQPPDASPTVRRMRAKAVNSQATPRQGHQFGVEFHKPEEDHG